MRKKIEVFCAGCGASILIPRELWESLLLKDCDSYFCREECEDLFDEEKKR